MIGLLFEEKKQTTSLFRANVAKCFGTRNQITRVGWLVVFCWIGSKNRIKNNIKILKYNTHGLSTQGLKKHYIYCFIIKTISDLTMPLMVKGSEQNTYMLL